MNNSVNKKDNVIGRNQPTKTANASKPLPQVPKVPVRNIGVVASAGNNAILNASKTNTANPPITSKISNSARIIEKPTSSTQQPAVNTANQGGFFTIPQVAPNATATATATKLTEKLSKWILEDTYVPTEADLAFDNDVKKKEKEAKDMAEATKSVMRAKISKWKLDETTDLTDINDVKDAGSSNIGVSTVLPALSSNAAGPDPTDKEKTEKIAAIITRNLDEEIAQLEEEQKDTKPQPSKTTDTIELLISENKEDADETQIQPLMNYDEMYDFLNSLAIIHKCKVADFTFDMSYKKTYAVLKIMRYNGTILPEHLKRGHIIFEINQPFGIVKVVGEILSRNKADSKGVPAIEYK